MKLKPLYDRIVVKRIDSEDKSPGGIIIPDSAKEKPIMGEVMAVGNGKLLDGGKIRPMDVKTGDKILFAKYAGTELTLDGEERLVLREDEVLGVVEG